MIQNLRKKVSKNKAKKLRKYNLKSLKKSRMYGGLNTNNDVEQTTILTIPNWKAQTKFGFFKFVSDDQKKMINAQLTDIIQNNMVVPENIIVNGQESLLKRVEDWGPQIKSKEESARIIKTLQSNIDKWKKTNPQISLQSDTGISETIKTKLFALNPTVQQKLDVNNLVEEYKRRNIQEGSFIVPNVGGVDVYSPISWFRQRVWTKDGMAQFIGLLINRIEADEKVATGQQGQVALGQQDQQVSCPLTKPKYVYMTFDKLKDLYNKLDVTKQPDFLENLPERDTYVKTEIIKKLIKQLIKAN
jgi:hypothetical protein